MLSLFEQNQTQVLPKKADLHILRKLWHISSGLLVLFIYFQLPSIKFVYWGYGLLLFSLVGFTCEYLRLKFQKINLIILKIFGLVLRESERNTISGLPFYALGCSVSILFFPERLAILSILFLIFSDPLSSLFGILYGKDKIVGKKTLQGSLAGFFVCYSLTLFYGLYYAEVGPTLLIFAFLAGVIGSLSELCSVFIDDNLTIPVLSGAGLAALNFILEVF